ncbi:Unknown protein [Striga hermonthica]|uniref:Uncharacterized protein n=1 Tax=Striga hermonthica TaxID=68872 RepID=A0A9N7N7G4_STRHE|nr:Unknown protein [Striga hermonthica]
MSLPTTEAEPMTRMAGATEHSWCRAVPGGTGITAVALLLSKPPNSQFLQNALRKFQISHPILNSKLQFDPPSSSFSYRVPPSPHLEILHFDPQSTAEILRSGFTDEERGSIPPLHLILEHELNTNPWGNQNPDPKSDADVFFASLYDFGEEGKWVLALRLHTSVCDRTSAAALLEDLLGTMVGGAELEMEKLPELCLAIEDCIPSGLGNKPFWARGVDMLGYSLNSFRLANLDFKDTESPRMSRVVRLQMDVGETGRILSVS